MTATQLSLLDQAKTGNPSAIAALMNLTLSKQGSHVKVKCQSGDYKLLVESVEIPDKSPTVRWILQGLEKLAIPEMRTVEIYGKSQQSAKPNWQHSAQFLPDDGSKPQAQPVQPSSTATATVAVMASVTIQKDEAPLDLSEQCFTRNQSLLSGNLTLPSKSVIKWVLAFVELSNAQKTEALPHIDLALRKSTLPAADSLSAATQAWFAQLIALEGPDIRKASIWLSRYCLNPQATIQQLSPTAFGEPSASASSQPGLGNSSRPAQTAENMAESPFPPYAGPTGKPPSAQAHARIVAASEGRRRFQLQIS